MQVISTKNGIRKHLKKECDKLGSISKWAKKHGFGRSYITEVISGKYDPTKSERLMKALKLFDAGLWIGEDEEMPTKGEIKKFLAELAEKKKRLGKMYDWEDEKD
jgi:hypothetical protein